MKHLNLILILSGIVFAIITRIILPFSHIFTANGILLNTPDAYLMLHYADTFPDFPAWDWYNNYPDGTSGFTYLVFPTLIAVVAKLLQISTLASAAILPPVLFFMTLVPIYLIAATLFNKTIASGSIFIFCLLSGEILQRTMLGAGDYHCWEIFLVSTIMMLVILALKRKEFYLALGTIVFYAIYWYSWQGAIIIPFILATGICLFAYLKFSNLDRILLTVAILAAILGIYTFLPQYVDLGIGIFRIDISKAVSEENPLLFNNGQFDMSAMMVYFGIAFYIVLAGIGWLIYKIVKYKRIEDTIFLSWTIVILLMLIARRRFDYYFAINAAILISFIVMEVMVYLKRYASTIKISIVAFIIVCLPLMKQSIFLSASDYGIIPQSWQNTTQYLRSQSNEKQYLQSSKPDYGVLTWWDYSYWITALGHQATYQCREYMIGKVLTAPDTEYSLLILKGIKARYIIIDEEMLDKKAKFIIRSAQYDSKTMPDISQSFMYRLYYEQIPQARLVYQSEGVKTFEIDL